MGRPQLAALGDGLAVGTVQPLPHIAAAAVAFGHADDRGQLGALHGFANFLGLRALVGQRVVEIALHEAAADRPGGSSQPDLPRISGNEGLWKRDQLAPCAAACSIRAMVLSTVASRSRKTGAA